MKKKVPGSAAFKIAGPTPHVFPVRNLRAAHYKAVNENYPDSLGLTVWTAVKGARPQVILFPILKLIIEELDRRKSPWDSTIQIKITESTAGLHEVRVGKGNTAATFRYSAK